MPLLLGGQVHLRRHLPFRPRCWNKAGSAYATDPTSCASCTRPTKKCFRDLANWCTPLNKTCSIHSTPKKQDGSFYKRKPADIYGWAPMVPDGARLLISFHKGGLEKLLPFDLTDANVWLLRAPRMQILRVYDGDFMRLFFKSTWATLFLPWKEFVKKGTPTEYA